MISAAPRHVGTIAAPNADAHELDVRARKTESRAARLLCLLGALARRVRRRAPRLRLRSALSSTRSRSRSSPSTRRRRSCTRRTGASSGSRGSTRRSRSLPTGRRPYRPCSRARPSSRPTDRGAGAAQVQQRPGQGGRRRGAVPAEAAPRPGVFAAPGKRITPRARPRRQARRRRLSEQHRAHRPPALARPRRRLARTRSSSPTLPFAQSVAPLLRGDFDAAVLPEPQATTALRGGARRIALALRRRVHAGLPLDASSSPARDIDPRPRRAVPKRRPGRGRLGEPEAQPGCERTHPRQVREPQAGAGREHDPDSVRDAAPARPDAAVDRPLRRVRPDPRLLHSGRPPQVASLFERERDRVLEGELATDCSTQLELLVRMGAGRALARPCRGASARSTCARSRPRRLPRACPRVASRPPARGSPRGARARRRAPSGRSSSGRARAPRARAPIASSTRPSSRRHGRDPRACMPESHQRKRVSSATRRASSSSSSAPSRSPSARAIVGKRHRQHVRLALADSRSADTPARLSSASARAFARVAPQLEGRGRESVQKDRDA